MTKYKISIALSFLLLLFSCRSYDPAITVAEMEESIGFMASDSLKGRYPGTREDSVLMEYIASEFKSYGLSPFGGSYIQFFEIPYAIDYPENNTARYGDNTLVMTRDYVPLPLSSNGDHSAPVVYAGYGFDFSDEEISRNDYSGFNLNNEWVLILEGEPEEKPAYTNRSGIRDKIRLAREKGAGGVLLTGNNDLSLEKRPGGTVSGILPVLRIGYGATVALLEDMGLPADLMNTPAMTRTADQLYVTSKVFSAGIHIERKQAKTGNVLGILEGQSDSLKNEWVLIGAHHDHLGMGGVNSSSRKPDTTAVHNGADDNASGVAAVLELAQYFSSRQNNARTLVFATFGAEEMGLLGSKYLAENSVLDLENMQLMINMDMLGRMQRDSVLQAGGVGTSQDLSTVLEEINRSHQLKIEKSMAGYGPSDHAAFYAKDVPVLFFSTGAHADYHTPFDDLDSLNMKGMKMAISYIAEVTEKLVNYSERLIFTEAGPRSGQTRSYTKGVTMGIMPDVGGGEEGLKVLAVTEGRPAYQGGIKKGDIIIKIEGEEIKNVYDYMYQLKKFKSGQSVIVTVKRKEDTMDLLIKL